MDKQGNRIPNNAEKVLEQFTRSLTEDDKAETPRKITPRRILFKSRISEATENCERERRERAAFERKVAFRAAQEQNPIRPRPRKKRGRKFR